MPASQRSARALFLRFTLVASRTWSGEKGKTQNITQLPTDPVPGALAGRAGTSRASPSRRAPSAAPQANQEHSCDEALADVKVRGMAHKSKATSREDRRGKCGLAASSSLHRTIESLRLEKTSKITKCNHQHNTAMPAKPCPEVPHLHVIVNTFQGMVTPPPPWAAPAAPHQPSCTLPRPCLGKTVDTVLGLSPEAAAHLQDQEPATTQGCCRAACAAWKVVCCSFQHVIPAGRTRQPSRYLLLLVFGFQLHQWESRHTVIKVLLE